MSRTKELGTAAGTLVCALGIGFAMQNTDAASERYGLQGDPVATAAVIGAPAQALPNEDSEPVVDVRDITLTSALPSFASAVNAGVSANNFPQLPLTDLDTPTAKSDTSAPQLACDILAIAAAKPGAMVELHVTAPCNGGQSVTVHHNGLVFKDRAQPDGTINVTVPAMSHSAVYIFAFETGEGAVAHAKVSDLDHHDRIALQWKGDSGFELHVREFGAGYGEAGHMWHEGRDMNGQFVRLGHSTGKTSQYAEVYTFPSDAKLKDGRVDLTVEAEVTEANCGSDIEAEALQIGKDGTVHTKTLSLTLPACDAVGNYLVLNNVFDGLKLASR